MHLLFSLFIHLAACIPSAAPSVVTTKDPLFAVMTFDYHSVLAIFYLFLYFTIVLCGQRRHIFLPPLYLGSTTTKLS